MPPVSVGPVLDVLAWIFPYGKAVATVTVAFPDASATVVPIILPAELLNVTVAPGEAVTAIC